MADRIQLVFYHDTTLHATVGDLFTLLIPRFLQSGSIKLTNLCPCITRKTDHLHCHLTTPESQRWHANIFKDCHTGIIRPDIKVQFETMSEKPAFACRRCKAKKLKVRNSSVASSLSSSVPGQTTAS